MALLRLALMISVAGAKSTALNATCEADLGAVVMIHGMHCTGAHFEEWRGRFEAAGFRVHAPTLRHHDGYLANVAGAPEPPAALGEASIEDYADDVAEYVAELDLPRPPVLVGHSMGGVIALKLLERGVGRAAALVAPAAPSNWAEVLCPEQIFLFHQTVCRRPFRRPTRLTPFLAGWGFFNALPAGTPERDRAEANLVYESGRAGLEMSRDFVSRLLNGGPTTATVDATAIAQRVAIFSGEFDRATPARHHRRIAQKLRCPLTTYRGMAHWLLSEPGWERVCDDAIAFSRGS